MSNAIVDRDEAYRILGVNSDLREVLFEHGGDPETFRYDEKHEHILFLLGSDEFKMTPDAYAKVGRHVGIPESLMEKCPSRFIIPIINHMFEVSHGDMKCLISKEDEVVGFTKPSVVYVPPVMFIEIAEKVLHAEFGNGSPFQYHHIHNDLYATSIGVISPNKVIDVTSGDRLNFGLRLNTSCMGEEPIVVTGYIFRLVCTNGQITVNNSYKFSRRILTQTIPQWVEDSCLSACRLADTELNRVPPLREHSVEGFAGDVLANIFRDHSVATSQREAIAERLASDGAETMYDIVNAFTAVANDLGGNPAAVRHLQTIAGHLVSSHDVCNSCHRPLMH